MLRTNLVPCIDVSSIVQQIRHNVNIVTDACPVQWKTTHLQQKKKAFRNFVGLEPSGPNEDCPVVYLADMLDSRLRGD